ncbi:SPRY-domain-containing protein [Gigaspora margarita]|uniref:SPRY-domain-containing protein n=1 Tax=Gigaspora margarita TaxID=4874 RepID=A0A8H4ABJ7_GIGMA|nr:SPRY-domain-containing protein [Gigaspora margarita]
MEETSLFNNLVLPTAWNIDDKSQFINIDSNGLKVNYTNPNDYKAVVIRANNPIPSQCGLFYFEVEITNEGKNGMIGVGYCTKQSDINIDDFMPGQGCIEDKENRENEEDKPWGNNDKMIFYTKNGVNLGIACYLPNNFDYLKNKLYPCIGLRSQNASIEANFGHNKFKYLTMTNDDIGKELWEACWINSKTFDQYVDKLKKNPSDTSALISRGKAYLIIGRYKEACEDLTGLIRLLIKEGEEDLTGLIGLLTKEKEDLTDLIRSRIKNEDLVGLIRLLMKEDDDDKKGEEEEEDDGDDEEEEEENDGDDEEEIDGDDDDEEEDLEDLISSLVRWRIKKEDLGLIRFPIKEEEGENKKKKEKEENDDHEKKKEEMIKKLEKSISNLIKLKKLLEIALNIVGEINYIVGTYDESNSDLHDLLKVKPDDAWAKEILRLLVEL